MTARNDTIAALHRLKRRIGIQRAWFDHLRRDADSTLTKERAFGESNVCSMAMGFIDDEIRRIKETR